jgi:hypothetical protein
MGEQTRNNMSKIIKPPNTRFIKIRYRLTVIKSDLILHVSVSTLEDKPIVTVVSMVFRREYRCNAYKHRTTWLYLPLLNSLSITPYFVPEFPVYAAGKVVTQRTRELLVWPSKLFGRVYTQRSTFKLSVATPVWYFCHLCDSNKVSGGTIFTTCGYYLHRAQTTAFQTSLTCKPSHQTPTKLLHVQMAAHKYSSVSNSKPNGVNYY